MEKNKFLWGCSSAATQIEGGAYEDGKGLSIWDVFGKEKRIFNEQTADVASDSYHRYKEDVKLLKELGVDVYRFSINWTRIIPNGYDDKINPKGIEYYNNLINELLKEGITPIVCLYHWDLPYEIFKKGGWLNKDIVKWFTFYTKVVAENFADRVKTFMIFNEPECVIGGLGGPDPDKKYSVKENLTMIHNLLLCYGNAAIELRKYKDVKITIGLCGDGKIPNDRNSKEDYDAAYKSFSSIGKGSPWGFTIFGDPIILGKYHDDYFKIHNKDELPEIGEHDMEIIHQVPDFISFNNYASWLVKSDKQDEKGFSFVKWSPNTTATRNGTWPVGPEGLYYLIKFFDRRYHLPILVTENGTNSFDLVTEDNKVHDGYRVEYLNQHIKQVLRAKEEGLNVMGYLVWSILDNLEWFFGYSERFGIVFVNFDTLERTKKDSYYFYQDIIKKHRF